MEAAGSRTSAYLGISLTPQAPAIVHTEVEKTVQGQKSLIQKFATSYFATQQDLELDSSLVSLTKNHQVILLSQVIKNLRGEGGSVDLASLTPSEKQMILIADKITAHATSKILAKTDSSNVEKEKLGLAAELQSHLEIVDNPVKNYLGVSTSGEKSALHNDASKDKVTTGVTTSENRQTQIEAQTHLIAILRGEIPMCSPSKWPPHLRESIQLAQTIATSAMGAIASQPEMTPEKIEVEQKKLASKLENDMLANGLVASKTEIATAKKGLFEAAPPDIMAKRITTIAQKHIDNNPLDNLQAGQLVKLSRKLVKGGEILPKSVFIFRQEPNGPLQYVVKYHKTATSTVQGERARGDSSEVIKAELGKGASNVAKRTVDSSNKPHVQKENISEDSNARSENRNERNALSKYATAGAAQTSHILLPEAQGSLATGETALPKGALKQVNSFLYPFAEGGELKKVLAGSTAFVPQKTNQEMKKLMQDVATGVSQIHALGLAHRDLKPENVLIHQGVAKIADHGNTLDPRNAAHNAKAPAKYNPLNQAVPFGGTVLYMAPEMLAGRYHNDLEGNFQAVSDPANRAELAIHNNQRVDLWAVGMILFQMMNTPTTDSPNFSGGPSLLQKECEATSEGLAIGKLIPEFDPEKDTYAADFAQFRKNCKDRFDPALVEAVIACFTVDPEERVVNVLMNSLGVSEDEARDLIADNKNISPTSALLERIQSGMEMKQASQGT